MTKKEFKKQEFEKGMIVAYKGATYNIIGVSFAEYLLWLDCDIWVRCENVRLLTVSNDILQ